MCGRFTGLTYDEVREVLRHLNDDDVQDQWDDWTIDADAEVDEDEVADDGDLARVGVLETWPSARTDVFPGMRATILAPQSGVLSAALLTWGYSVPWQDGRVFNTRIESALGGGAMWRDSIANRRCIVPTLGFFEPHATERVRSAKTGKPIKRQYRFATSQGMPTLLAGVWQRDEFSVLTTQPNGSVSAVHNRMPLVLRPSEVRTWLNGDYASLADRSDVELQVWPLGELYEPRQRSSRETGEPAGESAAPDARNGAVRRPEDGQLSLF